MAKKDKDKDKKEKGKLAKLVPIVVVVVVLLGGAKFLGLVGGKAAAAPPDPNAPPTTTTEVPGTVVALDPLTLNVADGHYLKVGLAFESDPAHAAKGGGHEAAATDPKSTWAKALDLAIEVLGSRTYGELVTPEGRAKAKADYEHALVEKYHGQLRRVYFTEFVLQ
jgi:flagellar FliL protein